jgi:UDP-arabinose 4-epimerase
MGVQPAKASVVVTGGAGFIGSHCCKALAAAGYTPVTFDNLSTGHRQFVKFGPFEEGDVRDTARLAGVLRTWQPVAVLHFAAAAYVGESVTDPAKYYSNNVEGMVSLLAAMEEAGITDLIFSSSCATYGIPALLPIDETTAQAPINPYGRTKLIGEMMLRDYAAAGKIRYGILRYFNACGADPGGDLFEWHEPETHLLPRMLMAATGMIDRLEIFGTDYDTADGTCVRDYIHVGDLARGHILALQFLLQTRESEAFNLGLGRGHSILDMLGACERVVGVRPPHVFRDRRPGDPPALVADAAKAKRMLGFEPEITDLDAIVRTALTSLRSVQKTLLSGSAR